MENNKKEEDKNKLIKSNSDQSQSSTSKSLTNLLSRIKRFGSEGDQPAQNEKSKKSGSSYSNNNNSSSGYEVKSDQKPKEGRKESLIGSKPCLFPSISASFCLNFEALCQDNDFRGRFAAYADLNENNQGKIDKNKDLPFLTPKDMCLVQLKLNNINVDEPLRDMVRLIQSIIDDNVVEEFNNYVQNHKIQEHEFKEIKKAVINAILSMYDYWHENVPFQNKLEDQRSNIYDVGSIKEFQKTFTLFIKDLSKNSLTEALPAECKENLLKNNEYTERLEKLGSAIVELNEIWQVYQKNTKKILFDLDLPAYCPGGFIRLDNMLKGLVFDVSKDGNGPIPLEKKQILERLSSQYLNLFVDELWEIFAYKTARTTNIFIEERKAEILKNLLQNFFIAHKQQSKSNWMGAFERMFHRIDKKEIFADIILKYKKTVEPEEPILQNRSSLEMKSTK